MSGDGPDMVMINIDHLPSLVAREASESFSKLLLPSLLAFGYEGQRRCLGAGGKDFSREGEGAAEVSDKQSRELNRVHFVLNQFHPILIVQEGVDLEDQQRSAE